MVKEPTVCNKAEDLSILSSEVLFTYRKALLVRPYLLVRSFVSFQRRDLGIISPGSGLGCLDISHVNTINRAGNELTQSIRIRVDGAT